VREDKLMSDIGAVAPAVKKLPVDEHQQTARDRGKSARRPQPRKPPSGDEMVEVESHTVNLEA
jgi:hypothetical protein